MILQSIGAVPVDCTLLYHYTSAEGVLGIIESDNIRATHVRFLNDWREFREAFQDEYVETLADSFLLGLPEDVDEAARRIVERVLSERNIPSILAIIEASGSARETFACSFTGGGNITLQSGGDPGDRLSQWRGYAHSSQGFSLGFDRDLLKKRVERDDSQAKVDLLECIYDHDKNIPFFQEMGRAASARFNNLRLNAEAVPGWFRTNRPNPTEEYIKASYYLLKSLSSATAEFFTRAARIKHRGFREEAEWRIVFQARHDWLLPDALKFRSGQFGPTPFVEVPLDLAEPETCALRRIVVGPGTHQEHIKHWVELLLRKHGIKVRRPDINDSGVEVATSLIPYRSR
jgi:hypothetical protein